MKARSIACLLLTACLCVGCRSAEPDAFLAPAQATGSPAVLTEAPAPTVQAQPAPGEPAPTASPAACSSDLDVVSDLTLPLGAQVTAGEALDKRWLVANTGSCDWQAAYRLKPVAGIALGTPEHALFPARQSAQGTLRVQINAPGEPGVYRGAWQAYDPQGNAFGEPLFIEIEVK